VYLTGIVRDHLNRKMSKSLGNSPDPIELMKIYGADGVRVGMLLCSAAGNDLLFDEQLTEQGRNFANKIWNAFRLVNQWNGDEKAIQPESAAKAIEWFDAKLNFSIQQMDKLFDEYRLSEALMTVYKLFWDEFSSWYLELVKPAFGQPMDKKTFEATTGFFDKLLKLLHPFMPFITEELWQILSQRNEGQSIMIELMPVAGNVNTALIEQFEHTKEIISTIRNVRKDKNIPFKEAIELSVKTDSVMAGLTGFEEIIKKATNISQIFQVTEKPQGAISFIVKAIEYYIPMSMNINVEEELEKLNKELEYTKGFLDSVAKKLSNEKFVQNAKADLVDRERMKLSEAESKIKSLEEQIKLIRN